MTTKKECDHGIAWSAHCDDCARDGETTYERMSRDKETAMYLAIHAYVLEETEQAYFYARRAAFEECARIAETVGENTVALNIRTRLSEIESKEKP